MTRKPDSEKRSRLASIDWRRVANAVGLVVLLAIVAVFVASAAPQLVGADHSYVVQSDSMSPAIDAGAVVFVSETPTDQIATGDVITFEDGSDTRVTHRVVEVIESDGQRQFRTKGDANEDPDPTPVTPSQVVGVVQFHVPYVGYVTSFAQTQLGLLALVIVPAILLVLSELWSLYNAAVETEDGETDSGGVDEP